MDNPLQGAIQKMGSNFLVAAFVPSMAFIVISSIAFDPMLPDPFRYLSSTPEKLVQSSLNLLLFTTILGFTLYTLSTYIYKSFEGYSSVLSLPGPLRRSFMQRQIKRFKNIEMQRDQVEKELAKIKEKIEKISSDHSPASWQGKRYRRYLSIEQILENRRYSLIAMQENQFPPMLSAVMPTRFGNILKAAETYPIMRYNIASVTLWGRLSHVIPLSGMSKLDHASNQALFLLNSSLLAGIFIIFCFLASGINAILFFMKEKGVDLAPFLSPNSEIGLYQQQMVLYFILALLAIGIAWLFYEASLFNVSQFGDMIRASYDLYRFNLLEALRIPLPDSLAEEKQTWRKVTEFMTGNQAFGKINFFYDHPENKKAQDEPEQETAEEAQD